MPEIAFSCPHCGKEGLKARLGNTAEFGPAEVDNPAQWAEITRRRQEYIGRQVMNAILAHMLIDLCDACFEDCGHQHTGRDNQLYECNLSKDHTGDHEYQVDHPSGVQTIARWPRLELVP